MSVTVKAIEGRIQRGKAEYLSAEATAGDGDAMNPADTSRDISGIAPDTADMG